MSVPRFADCLIILLIACFALPSRAETFTLKLLGPEDKPIAHASALVWVMPKPKDWDGTRRNVRSNENGIVSITYEPDGEVTLLGFNVKMDGFTPFYSEWGNPKNDPIPREYTVKLDKAESIGGIVTDDTGQPLAGATVSTSFRWGNRTRIPQGNFGCSVETTTNSEGRWRVGYVPVESLDEVTTISLKHPDFRQTNFQSVPLSRFAANADGQFTVTLAIERGIAVIGKVVDESGKPIAGATVFCSNPADSFRPLQATTDETGAFSFNNCAETNGQYILARAEGFAPELKDGLWFKADREPVNIVLKPGKTLRAKVVDTDGNPIPGSKFWVERWRTQQNFINAFDRNRTTDADGKLVWENLPADAIVFTIQSNDGKYKALRGQSLTASDAEYTFTLTPAMMVSAKVFDAKTGEPIPQFVIRIGYRFSGRAQISWDGNAPPIGRNGAFEQNFDERYDFVIKIEAEGYAPSISREILLSEKNVQLEFALEEPGAEPSAVPGLSGIILDPEGKPVARATVALALRNQSPYIYGGALLEGSNCLSARTDNEGRFTLPPMVSEEENRETDPDYKLYVLHPSGSAWITKAEFEASNTITLTKWARVEGTVYVGSKPARNLPLVLRPHEGTTNLSQPHAFFDYKSTSNNEGKFVFENVPPGKANVCIEIRWGIRAGGYSASGSQSESVELVSGETATVKLGGVGRPIIGKLTVPENFEGTPDWNFCVIKCVPTVEEYPEIDNMFKEVREKANELRKMVPENITNEADDEMRQRLWVEWSKTDTGKKYVELNEELVKPLNDKLKERNERQSTSLQRSRVTAVDSDGTFRINDVPAGNWTLKVELYMPTSPDQCGPSNQAAQLSLPIMIAEIPGGQSDEPLDVGTRTLETSTTRQRLIGIGAEAPDFELKRLGVETEEMIKLSDYRGKMVILDFWATWCGPCLAQVPELVKLHERIKDNPKAVFFGISIDDNEKYLLNFLEKKPEMAWVQLRTDPNSPMTQQYGVFAVPAMVVIGADGKVIAVNPGLPALTRMIDE